ncbi:ABC transporter permease [Mycolicibacterium wolinskyi]|uniref:Transport permease protein n=1 Tax=Mycolicibacterium wolinskyi TaxID=59750 RepID=A0A132PS20_9MYCO|nr:ABC transporter permease [Mycolicibacterium wolinskyi]KWX25064.1 ABC transporter [Mycolicibacterium wolinskyi]
MTAVPALTERVLQVALRDFDLLLGVLAPVLTLLGLNFALQNVIDTGDMSYTEYVLPATIIQAMLLGTVTAADRAAWEQSSGFTMRLRTQPISALAPLAARMVYALIRGSLALVATVITAYALGFRFTGGVLWTAVFLLMPLILALGLSLGADATGTWAHRVGAGQLLLFPQLLLVLVSTGLAPADSFPDWVQPFVQNQPVSQITSTLRGLAGGHVVGTELTITLAWCLGLLVVFGTIAVRLQRRRG